MDGENCMLSARVLRVICLTGATFTASSTGTEHPALSISHGVSPEHQQPQNRGSPDSMTQGSKHEGPLEATGNLLQFSFSKEEN